MDVVVVAIRRRKSDRVDVQEDAFAFASPFSFTTPGTRVAGVVHADDSLNEAKQHSRKSSTRQEGGCATTMMRMWMWEVGGAVAGAGAGCLLSGCGLLLVAAE